MDNKPIAFKVSTQELSGFAISPKRDCPHIPDISTLSSQVLSISDKILSNNCEICLDPNENWVCLICWKIFCSRYVNSHMAQHSDELKHSLAFSFSDGSFWCFECDSYVINRPLENLQRMFGKIKFPDEKEQKTEKEPEKESNKTGENKEEIKQEKEANIKDKSNKEKDLNNEEVKNEIKDIKNKNEEPEDEYLKYDNLADDFDNLKLGEDFTYSVLINSLKKKCFKKVVFLTGAGISVSAGIPDFRTPGTGLYSRVKNLGLERPEDVFELSFFKENPQPFYEVANGFLDIKVKPTTAHFFQKFFDNEKILDSIFTQNIDGLELDAGIPPEKLCQAHGHMRTCHCVKCHKQKDIVKMNEFIKNKQIYRCECGGLIKPDIVFFGEKLPSDFLTKINKINKCDLAFVIGTSLKVSPFNQLVSMVPEGTPIVLINKEYSFLNGSENFLFIGGDLDSNIEKIINDLGKRNEFEEIKKQILNK